MQAPAIIDELRAVVGAPNVLVDADTRASYETDWTRRFHGTAFAVVRPANTAEVVSVVECCARHDVAIVPQGGNTGLVGGGVPRAGEVVLSTRRLDAIEEVDRSSASVVVGAGATLTNVRTAARAAGLDVAVDLAARDSATIGGMVATNAGGVHVLRYGPMRNQLLGVEAVLADGSVIGHLPGLRKDNTGYSWPALLAGSEGTLAIITRVHLQLVAYLSDRVVALVGLATVDDAVALSAALRAQVPSLHAVEMMLASGVELVCAQRNLAQPFPTSHPVYLLVEVAGRTGTDALVEELAPCLDSTLARDVAVATDAGTVARLWEYREGIPAAVLARGVPHKLDVTLPQGRLADFCARVPAVVAAVEPAAVTFLFGHVLDGNVHVNVVGAAADDEHVDWAVLELVAALGGSISAEHGIGLAKRGALALTRSKAEIAAMRAVRGALDPQGRFNPGVLFES